MMQGEWQQLLSPCSLFRNYMRKLMLLLVCLPLSLMAQMHFGYFNYDELLRQLPDYASVTEEYETLQAKCDAEILRNEEELTRSYVAFLEGQSEFPEPILRKRQKELQELVDKSVIFRDQLKQWLTEACDSMYAPLHATIDDAVSRVCLHNNLAYAVDVTNGLYTFINPKFGYDITEAVLVLIEKNELITVVSEPESSASRAVENDESEVVESADVVSDEAQSIEL